MNTVMTQISEGPETIDKSHFLVKFQTWNYQCTLYSRLMWSLKMCEVTTSTVQKMDSKANRYIQKWLVYPGASQAQAFLGRMHYSCH